MSIGKDRHLNTKLALRSSHLRKLQVSEQEDLDRPCLCAHWRRPKPSVTGDELLAPGRHDPDDVQRVKEEELKAGGPCG